MSTAPKRGIGMATKAYLYDADGQDREVPIEAEMLAGLDDRSLLWIDSDDRGDETLAHVASLIGVSAGYFKAYDGARPTLDNYGDHFHFRVSAAPQHRENLSDGEEPSADLKPDRAPDMLITPSIDFVVCKQVLVTVHDGPVACLERFRLQDKADTMIGLLSPQALAASLMDWHLGAFFDEVSRIEGSVDRLDERVLREITHKSLLGRMVAMRRRVSKLRALLVAQRDVFYGLSRPDFALVTDSGAAPFYHALSTRFERALDEVERARDLVTGSFELFTSRSSQLTNDLVRILTFMTAIIGFCAAVAGLLGMNFQLSIFQTGYRGFLAVTSALLLTGLLSVIYGRHRHWI
jgi:magnesium transporter